MILGIGTDIIEIERIEHAIQQHDMRFLNKVFTKKEQEYAERHKERAAVYAGRFACKEAIVKAFGTGFGDTIGFLDIEIINNKDGKPIVQFSDKVQVSFSRPNILISISHCKQYATAFAVWTQST
jgi:holo-[acyl-carrier protein] synthase